MSLLLAKRALAPSRALFSREQSRLPPQRIAPQPQRQSVKANFFKFGKNGFKAEDAGIVGSQGRNDFSKDDVEHYFNYMGMLATEGTYDRMEAMMSTGLDPVDVLLLMACAENDTPKVEELLGAGANVNIKDNNGKSPIQLATKPEILKMLQAKGAVAA